MVKTPTGEADTRNGLSAITPTSDTPEEFTEIAETSAGLVWGERYVARVSPSGDSFQILIWFISERTLGSSSETTPSGFSAAITAVALSATVATADEPASQIAPAASTVAAVAISSTPESMVRTHCCVPVTSRPVKKIFEFVDPVFEYVTRVFPVATKPSALTADATISNFFTATAFGAALAVGERRDAAKIRRRSFFITGQVLLHVLQMLPSP